MAAATVIANGVETKRQKYEILRAQLEQERSSFLSHWRELGDHIMPRRPRFYTSDVNRGDRRNQKIIDSTPVTAARTLRSGMMGGITSPARPWFRLSIADPDLADTGTVKDWLNTVGQRMTTVFLKSNLYNVLPVVYGDLGTFATAAMIVEEDVDDVIRCYPFPIGSYCIAVNEKLKVDVFQRNFTMTVRQIIRRFAKRDAQGNIDWSNISTYVRNYWDLNQRETRVDIVHVIKANDDYDPDKLDSKFKRFESCYYEKGSSRGADNADDDRYLSEKGYDYFPVLAPRWETTGEDAYGTDCPGMTSLGDIKQLQLGERRSAQALDLQVKPPMKGPSVLKQSKASILPGDMTYTDERQGQAGFQPVFQVEPKTMELEHKQAQIRERINSVWYADLFLAMTNSDRRDITAREVDERHEEKLLALGPVLEQLNQDLLDPLIDITFEIMLRQGLIPPPPNEIRGQDLKVEYISIMAQAQKLAAISGIERFAQFASQIAAVQPEALDKIDTDKILDVYGDITSMQPGVVRPDDQVAKIRSQRAQVQQRQQMAAQINQGSQTARNLSQTSMEGDNALNRLIDQSKAGALSGPT